MRRLVIWLPPLLVALAMLLVGPGTPPTVDLFPVPPGHSALRGHPLRPLGASAGHVKSFVYPPTTRLSVRALVYQLDPAMVPTIYGQLMVHFNQPAWHAEWEKDFDRLTLGQRWRFCADYWTTLETDTPLTIGGHDFVPAEYYLLIERTFGDRWSLVVWDAAEVRRMRLDVSEVEWTRGGIRVPLHHELVSPPAEKLAVDLVADAGDPRAFTLQVRYGPHRGTVPVRFRL